MSISKTNKRIMSVLLILAMIFSLTVIDVRAQANDGTITLKGVTKPATINKGSPFVLRGKVKSKQKIDKISIGVVNQKTGKWVIRYYKKGVNSKTFNIKKADTSIKFGTLKTGIYYYRINVKIKGKEAMRVLNQKFSVVDNKAETVSIKYPENSALTLSGVKAPGTYPVGKEFTAKGTVTADKNIKKVEVGIVIAATNKWSEYKVTKKPLLTKTYDLSKIASKLEFNRLPGGNYYYRMYVHTKDGVKLAFNKSFTVTPSNKPKKAVKWAIKIANDNSFTYGKKPIANQQGCYFCGNNDKKVKAAKKAKMKKPERYEKTYVCLTFVGAAYAHGAGDPEILKECQKRRMTMYENNDNFKKFSCWMKIGSCKDLTVDDLLPGDVIIKWSAHNDNNGHVCMYVGGDKLVESSGGGWGENSIAVKYDAAASRLASLSKDSKNYVMRYRLP